MKVLLIGGTGQIGYEVKELLSEKGILCYAPDEQELNLEEPGQIIDCLTRYQPDMVVNAASYNSPVQAENEPSRCFKINRDASVQLADSCERLGAILIHISSYRIFDGLKKDAYTEKDTPNPVGVLATSRWQAEQQIRERCPRHIILRLSWVISIRRRNLLCHLLDQVSQQQEVSVNSDQLGCPTPAGDVARAIVAILQQLNCGADVWGTYHFSASEPVSENSFTEIVISEASQYQALKVRKLRMDKINDKEGIQPPANASLDCTKILNTFGIHTKPWRNALARLIKNYYIQQEKP